MSMAIDGRKAKNMMMEKGRQESKDDDGECGLNVRDVELHWMINDSSGRNDEL